MHNNKLKWLSDNKTILFKCFSVEHLEGIIKIF